MLNVVQRVGGSLGVAIFTVIPRTASRTAARTAPVPAVAFAHTYLWAVAVALLALIPALILRHEEARARRAGPPAQGRPAQPLAALTQKGLSRLRQ